MTDSQVLKRLDWPPYCVRILDNNLVAVSGGGGTSKTGVGNCIELGIVDYATGDASVSLSSSSSSTALNRAQFHTIHKYEPNDAIMKFVSFTHDRSTRQSKSKPPGKNGYATNASKSSQSSNPSTSSVKLDYDSTRNDLFLVAAVNDSIEVYKVQPTIDRLNKASLNSSSNSNLRQRNGSLRQSNSTQTLKPNGINHQSHSQTNETNDLKASAYLQLVHTVRLAQTDSFTNDDVFESEHTTTTNHKKSASRKSSAKLEDETIDTLAYCNMTLNDPTVYLCAGTSKGNIVIWNLYIDNCNDTNNNNDYSSTSINTDIKSTKIRIFKEAHGKQEVDELQVNHAYSHLLSIGKDNRCVIWSLKKLVKLCELDYLSMFGSAANLRMRHARFSNQGQTLYTTCIPKTRGGKKALNSYVQKWSCTELDEENTNYKLISKNCVRNTILTAMQASKDGNVICCGDYEGRVYLFDSNFCTLANFKKQHSCVVTDLAFYHDTTASIFNPNNKLMLSISIDRTLQCYTYLDTASTFNKRKTRMPSPFSLCSMNMFNFVFILIGFFLLFCWFFTHLE